MAAACGVGRAMMILRGALISVCIVSAALTAQTTRTATAMCGDVGRALTADPRVSGVVFTGSTATARTVAQTMAAHLAPGTPLIAETGGLNGMIVDSSALKEQAVVDTTEEELQTHLGVPAEEVPAILVECSKAIQHQG